MKNKKKSKPNPFVWNNTGKARGKNVKRHYLKYRIENNIDYCCDNPVCPLSRNANPKWIGIEISLQLDHINGNSYDNTIENLRLLCPNCHSLLDTTGGKNKNVFNNLPKGFEKKNKDGTQDAKVFIDTIEMKMTN
jgi:hypothetical protein